MNRFCARAVCLVGTLVVTSAVIPACATNDESIFVAAMLAPPANRVNGRCVYTADPQQPRLFSGTYDLALAESYRGTVLVGSQLIAQASNLNGRAESNRIHINGVIVRVEEPDGRVLGEFTSFGSGLANPQAAQAANFDATQVTIIDSRTREKIIADGLVLAPRDANGVPQVARRTSHTVLAKIRAFGTTQGGVEIESGEYQFPIDVCNGCLVSFTDSNDPTSPIQPNCAKLLAVGGAVQLPCEGKFGQDEVAPCQLCYGNIVGGNVTGVPACDPRLP